MKTICGKGAVIRKKGSLTNGMPCVIERYDRKLKKYIVNFCGEHGGGVGWYKKSDLEI